MHSLRRHIDVDDHFGLRGGRAECESAENAGDERLRRALKQKTFVGWILRQRSLPELAAYIKPNADKLEDAS